MTALAVLSIPMFLTPARLGASGVESCGANPDSTQTTSGGVPSVETFHPHRTGQKGIDLTARDVEHLWDSMYGLGLSDSVKQSLDRFTQALLWPATSPTATDARNIQVVYDYFRRQGSDWNPTNPRDSTAVRIGYGGDITGASTFTNEDRSHADGYLVHPARVGTGGTYPSDFTTLNEDSTSGRAVGDVRPDNSLQVTGPAASAAIDLSGEGWTRPEGLQRLNWNHELQHSFPGAVQAGAYSELWSAGAEVVGGVFDTTASNEVPYTWPLLANNLNVLRDSQGNPIGCGSTGWTNRWSRSNYQGRTSFMAYLAYNFLNADTARTLAGMRDDLMFRWRKSDGYGSLDGLSTLLADDSCITCRSKDYFRTSAGPLGGRSRLGVLLHNWRVATFVGNPALADSQFGYPAWSGFSPGRHQRAWQSIDGCDEDDIVAIPAILELGMAQVDRETTLVGMRSFRGAEMPLALAPYAANHWVIRPSGSLIGTPRTLVVNITPTECYSCDVQVGGTALDQDARILANIVGYDRVDGGGEESDLFRYPGSAVIATPIDSVCTDSLDSRRISIVVPEFGTTHKAAFLTLTLADGKVGSLDGGNGLGTQYHEKVPYRLDVRLLPEGASHVPPGPVSAVTGYGDAMPAWSWDSDEIAYSTTDTTVSPLPKVFRRKLDGSPHRLVGTGMTDFKQYAPDWSPRRNLIAFEGTIGSTGAIYVRSTTDSTASPYAISTQAGQSTMPAFQPNGQGVAYVHIPTNSTLAYLRWVGADGQGDRMIDTIGTYSSFTKPRWNADGTRILMPIESKGGRLHGVWSWGGEFTEEPGLGLALKWFDPHPAAGPILIADQQPLANRGSQSPDNPTFGCPARTIAQRVAMLDTLSAPRDTFYRAQHLQYLQDRPAWSKSGQWFAYERRHRSSGDIDLWVERIHDDHAPVLASIPDTSGETANALTFAVNASDADGEAVSFVHSTLPAGSAINNGQFIWSQPAAGVHYAIIRATDGSGDVDTRVVKLTIQQSVPPCEPFCGGGGGEWDPLSRRGGAGAVSMLPSQTDLTERNTFLDGVEPGALARQLASLPDLPLDPSGERYAVRLTTSARGGALVDAMRLHVVDHPVGVLVVATTNGILSGTAEPPTDVLDESGVSLGDIFGSSEDGVLMALGQALEFTWPASAEARGLALRCERASAGTGEGLAVQALQGGTWQTIRRIHPRRNIDTFGIGAISGDRVRLIADRPTRLHSVDRILLNEPALSTTMHVLEALDADGLENPIPLGSEDGAGLVLVPGTPASVRFDSPEPAEGTTRSFFLEVAGRYSGSASTASAQSTDEHPDLPREFAMGPALPNPTSGRVSFAVDLPRACLVRLEVLDPQGRIIQTIAREERPAGRYRFTWDGVGAGGRRVASGLYYARLRASDFTATRSVVVIP